MFLTRFFPAHGVMIFHPPNMVMRFDDLLTEPPLFVWDELQDPAVVQAQIGRLVPFAPALLPNFALRVTRAGEGWSYALVEQEGGAAPGFALLGLTAEELAALDDFELAPIHRLRQPCRIWIGDVERVASVHLAAGSYLGE
jgi:hypothetical protein